MGPLVAGIDMGSVGTKAVLFDGRRCEHLVVPTGWNPREAGTGALEALLSRRGVSLRDVARIVTTGYGRKALPFASAAVTEITCHALGASVLYPGVAAVLDIGGQDSKAIALDREGNVMDFLMNDKCAAGTGRFLSVMASLLEWDLDAFSVLPETVLPLKISSMCTVFAESEVVGLLAQGADKAALALGLLDAVASRAVSMLAKLGSRTPLAFTGGVSRSRSLVRLLEKRLGIPIHTSPDAQLAGALGAAHIAWRQEKKRRDSDC